MSLTANQIGNEPRAAALPAYADGVYSKVTRRLVPFLFVAYLLSFIDRANVGYAQLQMNSTLGFSDAAYGLGASLFFVGYALFELPSNLMLQRVGARATLCRIMVLWGMASTCTMFVQTPTHFYILRFLLGVFEAGLLPGVLLYLTYWYPSNRRAKAIALIISANVAAGFITGPVSGWILKSMDGVHGLHGWQWMFLLEGAPTVVFGILVFVFLPNRPKDASWLNSSEKELIESAVAEEGTDSKKGGAIGSLLKDAKFYLLSVAAFMYCCGGYFLVFWMPLILKELKVTDPQQVGLYAVVPNCFAVVAMILYGRHADRKNEHKLHWCFAFLTASIGFGILSVFVNQSLTWTLVAFSVAAVGVASSAPVFWAMTTKYLPPAQAAAGIALINTIGNLAGTTPAAIGFVKTKTGSLQLPIQVITVLLLVAAAAVLYGMPRNTKQKTI